MAGFEDPTKASGKKPQPAQPQAGANNTPGEQPVVQPVVSPAGTVQVPPETRSQSNAAADEHGAPRPKKKDRQQEEKQRAKQAKFGDRDEPASEEYMKWRATQVEKARGKDARRGVHDAKVGRADRTKSEIDEDIE